MGHISIHSGDIFFPILMYQTVAPATERGQPQGAGVILVVENERSGMRPGPIAGIWPDKIAIRLGVVDGRSRGSAEGMRVGVGPVSLASQVGVPMVVPLRGFALLLAVVAWPAFAGTLLAGVCPLSVGGLPFARLGGLTGSTPGMQAVRGAGVGSVILRRAGPESAATGTRSRLVKTVRVACGAYRTGP